MAIDQSVKDEVIRLYKAGKKLSEITKLTGVERPSIYFTLTEAGITPNRTKRRRYGEEPPPQRDDELLAWALDRIATLEARVAVLEDRNRIAREALSD